MKTALLLIATGSRYHSYVQQLLESAEKFLTPHRTFLWTDEGGRYDGVQTFSKPGEGYPNETLHRYQTILTQESILLAYDQLFYCDADMRFVAPVGEEIFSNGITATEHPGYVGLRGDPETRPQSTAYLPNPRAYFCGGFVGGATEPFLRMATRIAYAIRVDDSNGILAKWHDESHLNRYLFANPPAKVLTPEYCWPDVKDDYYKNIWKSAGRPVYEPKLLALTKGPR